MVGTNPDRRTGPTYVIDTTTGASARLDLTGSNNSGPMVVAADNVLSISTTGALRALELFDLPHLRC